MKLENKIKINGYVEITKEEFCNLKKDEGLRLFDYSQKNMQYFYKKKEEKQYIKSQINIF